MTLNQLNTIVVKSKNGNLFLQSTFYVPRIDYRNAGFKVEPPSKAGVTNVEVYIRKDESLPSIKNLVCINPIVHWIDLGNGYKVSKNGKINSTIKITLYELTSNPANRSGDDDKREVDTKETNKTNDGGEKP